MRATEHGPGLDVVVKAAGILERRQLRETTDEAWHRVLESISLEPSGSSVPAGRPSWMARRPKPPDHQHRLRCCRPRVRLPRVPAHKGVVVALTRELAAEFARHEITVNVVNPVFVRTAINEDASWPMAPPALVLSAGFPLAGWVGRRRWRPRWASSRQRTRVTSPERCFTLTGATGAFMQDRRRGHSGDRKSSPPDRYGRVEGKVAVVAGSSRGSIGDPRPLEAENAAVAGLGIAEPVDG